MNSVNIESKLAVKSEEQTKHNNNWEVVQIELCVFFIFLSFINVAKWFQSDVSNCPLWFFVETPLLVYRAATKMVGTDTELFPGNRCLWN